MPDFSPAATASLTPARHRDPTPPYHTRGTPARLHPSIMRLAAVREIDTAANLMIDAGGVGPGP
ncbi:hypothetical protein FXF52_18725 [Micromonospora sp. MP36]|nr:hypothetical protein FXF52_18725 [Micromonospora sp. MP36]